MANILTNIAEWFTGKPKPTNAYNQAFFQYVNGQKITFDYKRKSYLDAYLNNPDINAIINQIADKSNEVPYYIKKVADQKSYRKRERLMLSTKGNLSIQQLAQKKLFETKAFDDAEEIELKLKRPNPLHTWKELFALYRIFMETDGNAYFYTVKAEGGNNAGKIKQVYILPSNLVDIVLKKDSDTIIDDNPIDFYMLSEGDQRIKFPQEEIIHIKYANPNYDMSGSHLYGLSPLRAALKNIMSSDSALEHNVKNMKNGGVFGFFFADDKDTPLTAEQALSFKDKLIDMNNDPSNLARIAGASFKMGFQRLSLNADELKVIENLNFDRKVFANLLGWSDILLNSGDSSTYNNIQQEKRRVLTGKVQAGLLLLQDAFNTRLVPFLEGCDASCVWEWDISEMPEMQEDMEKMIKWMKDAYLTPNEIRQAVKYETLEIEGMDSVWVQSGLKRIDDVGITDAELEKAFRVD